MLCVKWNANIAVRLAWIALLGMQLGVAMVAADDLQLLILHNNDMHARFEQTSQLSGTCKPGKDCYGGFARVAHVINEARAKAKAGTGPKVLYLNAGDTYTGTTWFGVYKAKIVADFLNILKPDATSLGNHEFDLKPAGLLPFVNAAEFPILAANLDFSQEPELAASKIKPSVVLEVGDHKIGVIGYLTPETKVIASPGKVIFEDEVEALKTESEKLKSQGVKTIIALGHSGFETDKKIAEEVPLVDLVVGGHTNTFLYNGKQPDLEVPQGLYPTVVKQASGKEVPVVQAYAYTKYMGKLEVTINSDGDITHFSGQPMLLDKDVPQEAEVLTLLEKYRPGVLAVVKEEVGSTKVTLDGSSQICRTEECNFGNFITDAFVAYRSSVYAGQYWTDTPIAICNGGSIRNSLEVGTITRGDLLGALPFDNQMWTMEFTGDALLGVLEKSVYSVDGSTSRGEFLQVSGLHVVYNLKKSPGHRVVSAMARCGTCIIPSYAPVDTTKKYKVIIPQFLVSGGDGYSIISEKGIDPKIEDINDSDIVVWYLNKTSPIYPEVEGRITFNNIEGGDGDNGVGATKLAPGLLILLALVQIFQMNFVS